MYYHYTSIEAFLGIVANRKAWFGSVAFMNDKREGFELHSILSRNEDSSVRTTEEEATLDLVDTTIDTFLRFQFAFCATTLKDDISQWRAYAPLGRGICIAFQDGFFLASDVEQVICLYELTKKRAFLSEKDLMLDQAQLDQLGQNPEKVREYVKVIVKTLPRFKHYSFRPEMEIRWVKSVDGISDSTAEIKYRSHRLGLATYVEVDVDLHRVESVMLGPGVERQNQKTVEDFLTLNDCPAFVTTSISTLR